MITRSALIDMDSHLQKVEEAIVQAKLYMISCDDKRPPVYKYNDDMRICAGNFLHLIREAERELEMYRRYLEETKKKNKGAEDEMQKLLFRTRRKDEEADVDDGE